MISRVDHVSIAVKEYDRAYRFFTEILGAIPGATGEDPHMRYRWQILSLGDLSRVEILNPLGQGSFLDGFLKNKDGGVHHITLQTPDISAARKILDARGIKWFGYHEYPGGVWKELFIHPKDAFGVLIQIAEFRASDWISPAVKMPEGIKFTVKKKNDGCEISFGHEGGGVANISLNRKEMKELAEKIQKIT